MLFPSTGAPRGDGRCRRGRRKAPRRRRLRHHERKGPFPAARPAQGEGDRLGRSPDLRVSARLGPSRTSRSSGMCRTRSPLTVAGAVAASNRVPYYPDFGPDRGRPSILRRGGPRKAQSRSAAGPWRAGSWEIMGRPVTGMGGGAGSTARIRLGIPATPRDSCVFRCGPLRVALLFGHRSGPSPEENSGFMAFRGTARPQLYMDIGWFPLTTCS
ncbi:hypothetical protein Salmuc_05438 [Salipiger mucosus DSM 16094]|uniref:Uncharacterized protein n=1 Tax=Salipiger mucosus DSM 16094 TaxID=1123237 RepID=S9QL66_9RHOB|nr:hypothetical protein Salmuc_05438 [Salipiger mucosus DSM 16094]